MPDRCSPEALTAYLDDVLSLPERIGFERHLEACAACREALKGHGRVKRLVQAWVSPPIRPGFHERVNRRLEEPVA